MLISLLWVLFTSYVDFFALSIIYFICWFLCSEYYLLHMYISAHSRTVVRVSRRIKVMHVWIERTRCEHFIKKYLLFTIHFKDMLISFLWVLYTSYVYFFALSIIYFICWFLSSWVLYTSYVYFFALSIIIRAFLAYFKWDDMIYRSPNSIGSLFFICSIIRTATVKSRNQS
jgi:hypothetical protein